MFYINKIEVPFGEKGYYFWEHKLKTIYEPGFYNIFGLGQNKGVIFHLSFENNSISVFRQETLSKDNINLKLNYVIEYSIINTDVFFENFLFFDNSSNKYYHNGENKIRNEVNIFLNSFFAQYSTAQLANDKGIIQNINLEELNSKLNSFGVKINQIYILEAQFPKKVQDLYTQKLETAVKSEIDLENARTAISTARALKNASKMLQEDDGTKFLYYLETISKIANSGGKHTFNIGKNDL